MRPRRRAGFTFVELMIAVTIIGLLSSIAVPKYHDMKRKAIAAAIIGDFDVVKVASMAFFADSGYFPKESSAGRMPKGLANYLPLGFAFNKDSWTLDYDNLNVRVGGRRSRTTVQYVGISVRTQDSQLGQTALRMLGTANTLSFGSKYLYIFYGL